ncbi:MAG: diguanylate cyclase [Coleofasciculaceae cyanobacterium SM2_3_26]|nr:diguanylate cyclase [Coleofasciculaceae cyanobacterium SM2_3_26]
MTSADSGSTSTTAIAALRLEHETHPASLYVTLSFGVASVVPSQQATAQTLLNLADQMLYRAKRSGRDRYEAMGD